jgi:hypothetical protein
MKTIFSSILAIAFFTWFTGSVYAQSTEFTYQGRLQTGSIAATGSYDFEFTLFDAATNGTQLGSIALVPSVTVTNGIFNVRLDFGDNFDGGDRFLSIRIRQAGSSSFETLNPRQPVNSTPYAIKSLASVQAKNAEQLGGVEASEYVVTTDPRMSDQRAPTANSPNYIRNSISPQSNSNFSISGDGILLGTLRANTVNASTQYNLGNVHFASRAGTNNIFLNNDSENNTGGFNTFVGSGFNGADNTTGTRNTFVGSAAGRSNTLGINNSFVGASAGQATLTGSNNAFFGTETGLANTTGFENTFLGSSAGRQNTFGRGNTFVGRLAGGDNRIGELNTFLGLESGDSLTSGSQNTFLGSNSGSNVLGGSNNTAVGSSASVASETSFATAIGSGTFAVTSNTIALGRSSGIDTVLIPGKLELRTLGSGGPTPVCRNTSLELSLCSSSLRYKENINEFRYGLDLVKRLRPVSFNWIEGKMLDLGLVAEEVAAIEPLLATTDGTGRIEGVKYDRVGVVLINAVNEQQNMIDTQTAQIKLLIEANRRQAEEIAQLKRLVCSIAACKIDEDKK